MESRIHGNVHVRFGGGLTRCPEQSGSTLPTLLEGFVLSSLADVSPADGAGRF